MSTRTHGWIIAAITPLLILSLCIVPISDVLLAAPQDKCESELAEAENKYQIGELDQAIELVNKCLAKQDLSLDESEKAYKLLGKAYHAKGLLDQAKQNLRKLIELIPNWQPNPDIDTPSFQRLAEDVIRELQQQQEAQPKEEAAQPEEKPEQPPAQQPEETEETPAQTPPERETTQPKKGGSKTALFVAGGVGLVGAAIGIALGLGGGDGEEPPVNGGQRLADPPPLPPNP